jgi:hypothetical protein
MGSSAPQVVDYLHGKRVEADIGNSSPLYRFGSDACISGAKRFNSGKSEYGCPSTGQSCCRRFGHD